jgi:hypothetical protein
MRKPGRGWNAICTQSLNRVRVSENRASGLSNSRLCDQFLASLKRWLGSYFEVPQMGQFGAVVLIVCLERIWPDRRRFQASGRFAPPGRKPASRLAAPALFLKRWGRFLMISCATLRPSDRSGIRFALARLPQSRRRQSATALAALKSP